MNIRIVESTDEFRALRDDWNRLAESRTSYEPFDTWEWVFTAHESGLLRDARLFIVVLENENEVKAIAPLCIKQEGCRPFRINTLLLINGKNLADYGSILLHPNLRQMDLLEEIFGVLWQHRNRWDIVHLHNLNSRLPLPFLISNLPGNELPKRHLLKREIIPYISLKSDGGPIVQKGAKATEARKKRLCREHEVDIEIGGSPDGEFWDKLLELHLARWPESIFRNESNRKFHAALLPRLASRNMLEISRLRVDGEIVALHYGFKTDKKICYYLPVVNPEYLKYAPGAVLLKEVVAHYNGEGTYLEFDFLKGCESYKFRWTDQVSVNHDLLMSNGKIRGRIACGVLLLIRSLANLDWMRRAYNLFNRTARKARSIVAPFPGPASTPDGEGEDTNLPAVESYR